MDKRDHIEVKSFRIAKETINKLKTQSTEQEKIFANYPSDKGLKPDYIKNSTSQEKSNNPIRSGKRSQ